jgi:hypothetical protein
MCPNHHNFSSHKIPLAAAVCAPSLLRSLSFIPRTLQLQILRVRCRPARPLRTTTSKCLAQLSKSLSPARHCATRAHVHARGAATLNRRDNLRSSNCSEHRETDRKHTICAAYLLVRPSIVLTCKALRVCSFLSGCVRSCRTTDQLHARSHMDPGSRHPIYAALSLDPNLSAPHHCNIELLPPILC